MNEDIKRTIGEVIKKQIIILGPDIAILKAREVLGLEISDNGDVTNISSEPLVVLQNLVDKYVSLSGMIVKKAMEPLIQRHLNINNGSQSSGKGVISSII